MDPEVCPGGPNYKINFMMKFSVGLAANPYERLCWMAGQMRLSVGVTLTVERWMDSLTYHTSEPALYLSIHILIISICGIMNNGFVCLSVHKLENHVFLFPLFLAMTLLPHASFAKYTLRKSYPQQVMSP